MINKCLQNFKIIQFANIRKYTSQYKTITNLHRILKTIIEQELKSSRIILQRLSDLNWN